MNVFLVYMYVCMYVCTYVCVYMCTYIINITEWLPTDTRDSKQCVRLVPYQTPCRVGTILIDFQEALSSKDLCRGSGCKIT